VTNLSCQSGFPLLVQLGRQRLHARRQLSNASLEAEDALYHNSAQIAMTLSAAFSRSSVAMCAFSRATERRADYGNGILCNHQQYYADVRAA